jgi:hypothetical protein
MNSLRIELEPPECQEIKNSCEEIPDNKIKCETNGLAIENGESLECMWIEGNSDIIPVINGQCLLKVRILVLLKCVALFELLFVYYHCYF